MPITPTFSNPRGGGGTGAPSSPPRLPPPRHLSRTTRLPPPSTAPLNFTMDDDPFASDLSAAVGHDRHRRRPNPSHLPPPPLSRSISSSSDDEGASRRMMMSQREEEMLPSWTGPVSSSAQSPMFYHTQAHISASQSSAHFGSEIEESSSDPAEAAQLQELVVGDSELDEDDTGNPEETKAEEVGEETGHEGKIKPCAQLKSQQNANLP